MTDRDRDRSGRARNARPRDPLGRPMARTAGSAAPPDPPPLPPAEALARGQQLLAESRPFEAHEVFEAVWKDPATPEGDRALWRGLAQLAVGVTHRLRGNEKGAAALLRRAAESLAPEAGRQPHGVAVDGLRAWLATAAETPRMTDPPRLTG